MKRENFQSRLGFILVSAGCAIGIGNVWKFPYVTGENGGGVFVLFYLLFLVIMGVPVLTMELAVGRASRKSAVEAYRALEPQGSKWHIHGWFCVIGCCLLMMYYTTVAGWMLDYFYKFATGAFDGMPNDAVDGVFSAMLANPSEMTVFMVIIVLALLLSVSACAEGAKVETFSAEYEMVGTTSAGLPKNDTFIFEGETTDGIITKLNFDIVRNKGAEDEYSKKDIMGYMMNVSDATVEAAENGFKLTTFTVYGYDPAFSDGDAYYAQYMVSASCDALTEDTLFQDLTFLDMANENFRAERVLSLLDEIEAEYTAWADASWERWNANPQDKTFAEQVEELRVFFKNRFDYIVPCLAEHFGLTGSLAALSLSADTGEGDPDGASIPISLNTLSLELDGAESWQGQYYTDYPVTLTAQEADGLEFVRWEVDGGTITEGSVSTPSIQVQLNGDTRIRAVYE